MIYDNLVWMFKCLDKDQKEECSLAKFKARKWNLTMGTMKIIERHIGKMELAEENKEIVLDTLGHVLRMEAALGGETFQIIKKILEERLGRGELQELQQDIEYIKQDPSSCSSKYRKYLLNKQKVVS